MLMRYLLLLVLSAQYCLGQDLRLAVDCSDATEIAPKGSYLFAESPKGYGRSLEIRGNDIRNPLYFQRENNTAWFWFEALTDDLLVFRIYPKDTTADFDFMLFEYTDEDFCTNMVSKKVKPIRSNISRFNPQELSVTGLSAGAKDDFVPAGPGNHFSKAVNTVKGKRYYLVIDNVYGTETSFHISFDYYTTTTVSGSVKDEDTGQPIGNATVTWEERTGEVLAIGTSDPETGEYSFTAPIRKGNRLVDYVLSITEPQRLFSEQRVKASSSEPPKPLVAVLPTLKKGRKMALNNINFFGNSETPLPSSRTSLKRVLRLMRSNNSLVVRIEGHTHACGNGIAFSQRLSEARAQAVKNYLVKHGIKAERISTIGLNCSQMLFPQAKNAEEQELNRRVEFMVVEY